MVNADVRPTILSLVGLKDDYADDGHGTSRTARFEQSIAQLTPTRDTLAGAIGSAPDAAASAGTPISQAQAQSWIASAAELVTEAQGLS